MPEVVTVAFKKGRRNRKVSGQPTVGPNARHALSWQSKRAKSTHSATLSGSRSPRRHWHCRAALYCVAGAPAPARAGDLTTSKVMPAERRRSARTSPMADAGVRTPSWRRPACGGGGAGRSPRRSGERGQRVQVHVADGALASCGYSCWMDWWACSTPVAGSRQGKKQAVEAFLVSAPHKPPQPPPLVGRWRAPEHPRLQRGHPARLLQPLAVEGEAQPRLQQHAGRAPVAAVPLGVRALGHDDLGDGGEGAAHMSSRRAASARGGGPSCC